MDFDMKLPGWRGRRRGARRSRGPRALGGSATRVSTADLIFYYYYYNLNLSSNEGHYTA